MTLFSSVQRKKRKVNKIKLQGVAGHDEFLNRITKTLYYEKITMTDRFSLPVSELAAELFSEVKKEHSLDRLYVDEAAEISRNACVSPCSLVLALVYLERLKCCNVEYVEKAASSDLFLVSMMVASKFLHDDGEEDEVFNGEWATSAGFKLKDINRLEREFLKAINWEVYVSEQVFWSCLHDLETRLALQIGNRRGWFTYTELVTLVNAAEFLSFAHCLIAVSAVCITSYTASVFAMVGSTILVNQTPSFVTSMAISSLHWPLLLSNATLELSACSCDNFTVNPEWSALPSLLSLDVDANHSQVFPFPYHNRLYGTGTHLVEKNNEDNCDNYWSEQKVLTAVNEILKVVSTPTYLSMVTPVEILTY